MKNYGDSLSNCKDNIEKTHEDSASLKNEAPSPADTTLPVVSKYYSNEINLKQLLAYKKFTTLLSSLQRRFKFLISFLYYYMHIN